MNTKSARSLARGLTLGIMLIACCLVFNGCQYEVPITSKPTRKIDERLLGNWTSKDGKDKMQVVKLDDSDYIVYSGGAIYRVYHSDLEGTPFVTVLQLTSDSSAPTYYYWAWRLSGDGKLILRVVNDKVIPDSTKGSMNVRQLLRKNMQNPALFSDGEEVYTRDKSN